MNSDKGSPVALAGDIGGTKTNLGFFTSGDERPEPIVVASYSSTEAASFEDVAARFAKDHPASVVSACFGIAGPVIDGVCQATNLPWRVSEFDLKKHFGWRDVRLINDLAATALAVPLLREDELYPLNPVPGQKGGTIGIVAPGTGLGMALLAFGGGRPHLISSEGGHGDFAPRTDEEVDLWRYLHALFDHVSIERVVSGPGLFSIYSWLRERHHSAEPTWLTEEMRTMEPAAAISEAALTERDPLCVNALDLFVSILASSAANLALTAMTTGGIYLGGGIPPKILPKLKDGTFLQAFVAKGRFRKLVSEIPVRVILNDKAALLGAAWCAAENMDRKIRTAKT
jgi:glucokinase